MSLFTPRNMVSPEEAQAILDAERAQMEQGGEYNKDTTTSTPITE
ncbi:hypothetical protein JCM19239_3486 [Vibrio variabilis]|uniref:Uncharacterized protein n=1 Tax=Vibrio variabilis TaxID=990271 RepID=A0ABQ0JKK8_9VIBR|nr:hypothetical protein JCM19239_3486 [Vibrio variabilis]